MNNLRLALILAIPLVAFFLSGCTTIDIVETIRLHQAEVNGPVMPAPVHLTDSTDTPSFTISQRFSYNMNNQLTGEISNIYGSYPGDSIFTPAEHSLIWNISEVNAGVDMDPPLSKNFSFTFGLNYSSDVNYSSWGGNIGLGAYLVTRKVLQ